MEDDLIVRIEAPAAMELLMPLDLLVKHILLEFPAFTEAEGLVDMLELAFHEAFANICCHSYRSERHGPTTIQIRVNSNQLEFRFEDNGASFDPALVPIPDLEEGPAEEGMGIWLIRQIMDHYLYHCEKGGRNVLRLIKEVRDLTSERRN